MPRISKIKIVIVAFVAAIGAFLGNINTIIDFFKNITGQDNSVSIEIADIVNHRMVVWSRGGELTGEISYIADLFIKKNSNRKISDCNVMINIGNSAVYYSDNSNRFLEKGQVAINWHYEHKIKRAEFAPDVTLQIQCDNIYSNVAKVNFVLVD